jgi:hypothetical protein
MESEPRLTEHGLFTSEPVFVNILGAQESIPKELIPPGWESIPGLLKRFKYSGSVPFSTVCTEKRRLESHL